MTKPGWLCWGGGKMGTLARLQIPPTSVLRLSNSDRTVKMNTGHPGVCTGNRSAKATLWKLHGRGRLCSNPDPGAGLATAPALLGLRLGALFLHSCLTHLLPGEMRPQHTAAILATAVLGFPRSRVTAGSQSPETSWTALSQWWGGAPLLSPLRTLATSQGYSSRGFYLC